MSFGKAAMFLNQFHALLHNQNVALVGGFGYLLGTVLMDIALSPVLAAIQKIRGNEKSQVRTAISTKRKRVLQLIYWLITSIFAAVFYYWSTAVNIEYFSQYHSWNVSQ